MTSVILLNVKVIGIVSLSNLLHLDFSKNQENFKQQDMALIYLFSSQFEIWKDTNTRKLSMADPI